MVSLSCLAGPDKQSSSKMDVLAALDSLSTLDAIISDSGYESGSVGHDKDDDDGQLPTEHYLTLAESLDIAQLQQNVISSPVVLGRHCQHIKTNAERQWERTSDSEEMETALGLNKDTIVKVEDVVAQVATENELTLVGRPKKNMYIEDVADHHRQPSLVPDGGRPRLFIFLKPEFTKRFLGDKALNKFKIPEIIFDPTLVLSPHICLLTMLFHIGGFKSISTTGPVLDSAEKLYSVKVLDGKGQQPLLLKDELLDKFVFCQMELTSTGFKICLDKRMTPSMVSSRMRRAGEIMGFEEVAHLYNFRYAGAKAFNNSEEVTEALQNVMLQHADIRTFVKHYQVDVDVDAQGIVRKTGSQTELVRFACSMSASIDPNRPFKLSPEESRSLKYLPVVLGRQECQMC
ncbi:hypothetical protein ACO22_04193 [Paracoccidioides brasiliensis]|uniref:Uncharacterized protein n=1 Tax=Paracoccidioides brasiliensis TaxID=121759 RepID=A0A1D2JDU1_PARBR|nr:hypothetical protein ACO22_04193 [Paracoccidioides brasiliensis]